jgi:hypothetical protein
MLWAVIKMPVQMNNINKKDTEMVRQALQEKGLYSYLEKLEVIEHNDKEKEREIVYKRKETETAQSLTIKQQLENAFDEISKRFGIPAYSEESY